MDPWRYFDITHRDHVICNPTSVGKLDEVIGLLDLRAGARVLDVGSGKGEPLLRLAERYGGPRGAGFHAVAVDPSPYFVATLREAAARRVPLAEIELREQGGADYPAAPGSFDLGICLGASWAFGGHGGTLRALAAAVTAGGQVLVGEPFWRHEPAPEYLEWAGLRRDEFGTHAGNVEAGVEAGLVPMLAYASTDEEWDRYETLQWRAVARHAAANPDDPDLGDLVARADHSRHEYLAWGRDTLGWAIYLFRRP